MQTEKPPNRPLSKPAALMRAAQAIVERRRRTRPAAQSLKPAPREPAPPLAQRAGAEQRPPGPPPELPSPEAPRAPDPGARSFQGERAQPGRLLDSIDTVTVPKGDGSGHEVLHADSGRVIAEGRNAAEADARAQELARQLGRRRMQARFGVEEPAPTGDPSAAPTPGESGRMESLPAMSGDESGPAPDEESVALARHMGDDGSPLGRGEVDEVLHRVFGRRDPGGVEIHDSPDSLPPEVKQGASHQLADYRTVPAVTYRGTIHLVRSNLRSRRAVETALFHERFHQAAYRAKLAKQLLQLYHGLDGVAGIRKYAGRHGLSRQLEAYIQGAENAGREAPHIYTPERRAVLLANELLAHVAQKGPLELRGRARAWIGEFRAWLRERGFPLMSKMGESDIARILRRAERYHLERAAHGEDLPTFVRGEEASTESPSNRRVGRSYAEPSLPEAPRAPGNGGSGIPEDGKKLLGSIPTRVVRSADGGHEVVHPDSNVVLGRGKTSEEAWAQATSKAKLLGRKRLLEQLQHARVQPLLKSGDVDGFVKGLQRKNTPANRPCDLFEIEQTGSLNYLIAGGGTKFWIDGYEGRSILEAKFVDLPGRSPYWADSAAPPYVRNPALEDAVDEFRRLAKILRDPEVPFNSLDVVVNDARALLYFESLMRQFEIPGKVRVVKTKIRQRRS
jgi:hypothetical protein